MKAFVIFLDNFEKGDDDWEELLFKVWVARVLNHTIRCISLSSHACLMSQMILLSRLPFNMLETKCEALFSNMLATFESCNIRSVAECE